MDVDWDVYAIRAPRAFDGRQFLRHGATVLVDGGRVTGVETFGFEPPTGVPVTTYDGCTLLPGLFDMHTHLVADGTMGSLERAAGLDETALDTVVSSSLARQLAKGVTTVRDLGDRRYNVIERRDRQRAALARGETLLEPRILAAGPPITKAGGHCHYLGGAVADEGALRRAVTERCDRAVDVVKVMASGGFLTDATDVLEPQFSLDDLRLLVDEAHSSGLPVTAHAHALAAVRFAVEAGVDGIEHCSCLSAEGFTAPAPLLSKIASSGVPVCLTLGSDATVPPPSTQPPQLVAFMQRFGLTLALVREGIHAHAARVCASGIRLVNGVDSGISPMKDHGNAWIAVGDLVRAGLPVSDALASATSAAAEACGLADTTGALRPRLSADLLVVRGDLEQDISALGATVSVVVRGHRAVPREPA